MSAQGPSQTVSIHQPTSFGGSAVPTVTGTGGAEVNADINVTPMVDVMLVLLIIFMVVTPILAQYEATPPEAQFVMPEPDEDVVTLGIDENGAFFLENEPVPDAQLARTLQDLYARRPGDHLMFLRADRGVGYDVVLDAVEAARYAGVRTIGAIATPVEEQQGD